MGAEYARTAGRGTGARSAVGARYARTAGTGTGARSAGGAGYARTAGGGVCARSAKAARPSVRRRLRAPTHPPVPRSPPSRPQHRRPVPPLRRLRELRRSCRRKAGASRPRRRPQTSRSGSTPTCARWGHRTSSSRTSGTTACGTTRACSNACGRAGRTRGSTLWSTASRGRARGTSCRPSRTARAKRGSSSPSRAEDVSAHWQDKARDRDRAGTEGMHAPTVTVHGRRGSVTCESCLHLRDFVFIPESLVRIRATPARCRNGVTSATSCDGFWRSSPFRKAVVGWARSDAISSSAISSSGIGFRCWDFGSAIADGQSYRFPGVPVEVFVEVFATLKCGCDFTRLKL